MLRYSVTFLMTLFLFGPVGDSCAEQFSHQTIILLSEHDAEQLRLSGNEDWPKAGRTRSLLVGPRIVIKSPEVKASATGSIIETSSPTTLAVLFEQGRAPVDMTSLQVRAKKGFFSKSLTQLFLPYIQGTQLMAQDVTIPEGRFFVEIEIADVNGVKTVEAYGLEVSKR